MQAHQSKHCIGGLTSRERERERCVCVLFEFRQFVFFTLGTRPRISKCCLARCLAVSILEYNINWNSKSAGAKAFWFSEGRMK